MALLLGLAAVSLLEVTSQNFDKEVVTSGKTTFVKFFAPWCGHCKAMAPAWEKLAEQLKGSSTVLIGDVDCTTPDGKILCSKHGVKSYPTLKIFSPGETEGKAYKGGRDLVSLQQAAVSLGGELGDIKPEEPAVAAGPVLELTPQNFDKEVVASGKTAFVKFFAPWCGHCKAMKPDWDKLGVQLKGSSTVLIGDVDCTTPGGKKLCSKHGVKSYPTLKIFSPGKTEGTAYNGGRDLVSLQKEAVKLGGELGDMPAAGPVLELTPQNFDKEVVASGKAAFVKFFAPWCGHCKAMAPDWEKLAKQFKGSSTVLIGEVDCTTPGGKKLCPKHGVKSYPTLKIFSPGETEGKDYNGGRDLAALQKEASKLGDMKSGECHMTSLENCELWEIAEIERLKTKNPEWIADNLQRLQGEIDDLAAAHLAKRDRFRKIYDESLKNVDKLKEQYSALAKIDRMINPIKPE